MKIMISAQGRGKPQAVTLTHESMLPIKTSGELVKEILYEVPVHLWAKSSVDIGLVKSAQPIRGQGLNLLGSHSIF